MSIVELSGPQTRCISGFSVSTFLGLHKFNALWVKGQIGNDLLLRSFSALSARGSNGGHMCKGHRCWLPDRVIRVVCLSAASATRIVATWTTTKVWDSHSTHSLSLSDPGVRATWMCEYATHICTHWMTCVYPWTSKPNGVTLNSPTPGCLPTPCHAISSSCALWETLYNARQQGAGTKVENQKKYYFITYQ